MTEQIINGGTAKSAWMVDQTGAAFGTQGNPLATNQLVGTPVYATGTSASGAQVQASLPAAVGKTTYINGFYASCDTSAAAKVQVTVSFDGGTTVHMNFLLASSASVPGVVDIDFPDPIPAKSPNTSIVVTIPAVGGASTNVSLSVYGYQL